MVCNHEANSKASPPEFKQCRLVAIKKAGKSGDDVKDHRTISMIDSFQKLLESLVISKLVDLLEEVSGPFSHFAIRKKGCHTAMEQFYKNAKKFEARGSNQ